MASIYEIVGDNFFTPLASKNRRLYVDSILYLHKLINELFEAGENDKNRIIDALAENVTYTTRGTVISKGDVKILRNAKGIYFFVISVNCVVLYLLW